MSNTGAFVRIDTKSLLCSELLLLSPKAFRAVVVLAGWSGDWGMVGSLPLDMIGTLLRLNKRGTASLLKELTQDRGLRRGAVASIVGSELVLNERFIRYGRDEGWSRRDTGKVLERDGRSCRYCGTECFDDLSFDHVFPRSRGGGDNHRNLVVACMSCNSRKSDRTPEEAGMPLLPVPVRKATT